MTTLATIPATVTQASSEDITWGNDVSAQLVNGQTVTLPVVTITDLSVRGQPQLGFTYGPSVTGAVISQRIPEGMLTALHNYRLVWGFTPSGTTDIRESATGVICPFGPAGSCPPAPRVGFLESANNLSDVSNIVTAVANLGLGGVVSGVATNVAAIATETARAEGAEFTLTTGLASEITRATGAESALRTTVSGLAATAWLANTAYPAEAVVTNGAVLWQAPSPSGAPSRATFTPSDWTELATIALPVGTTSGTVAAGSDSRFAGSPAGTAGASLSATDATTTNTRTPSTGSVTSATIASGGIALPSASTATTQSPMDSSTKLATTAYTDAATLVEKNRATTAEASLLPGPLPGQAVSTSITLTVNTHAYCNATSGPLSEALPTGQPLHSVIVVEKSESSVNTVTATGSIRGVGSSSLVLALAHESIMFEADSSGSWWPIAGHKTLGSLDARYQSDGTSVQIVDGLTTDLAILTAAEAASAPNAQIFYMPAPTGGDDTANILAAFASGKSVLFPKGHYQANSAVLRLFGVTGLFIRGMGEGVTTIQPSGSWSAANPVMLVENCSHIEIDSLTIYGQSGANKPSALIESRITSSTLVTGISPTDLKVWGVTLGSTSSSSATTGIAWTKNGTDQNNDQATLISVHTQNIDTPFSIQHSQSKGHTFMGCTIAYAIDGVNASADFHWYGGTMVVLSGACFNLSNQSNASDIHGLIAESCSRLVISPRARVANSLSMDGVAFACDALNADGNAVIWGYQGALKLSGVTFGQPGAAQAVGYVSFLSTANFSGTFAISGCTWSNYTGPNLPLRFDDVGNWGGVGVGNTYMNSSQTSTPAVSPLEVWQTNSLIYQITTTGAVSLGSNKLTNMANGAASADGVNYGQLVSAVAALAPLAGPFAPTGFIGAVTASRYVGATTSGAPTTGTFQRGDFVIDLSPALWVCTTAGIAGSTAVFSQIVGAGSTPTGAAGGALSGTYPNPTLRAVVKPTSTTTLANVEVNAFCSTASGTYTLTLGSAAAVTIGTEQVVRKVSTDANLLTIAAPGGQTIDGDTQAYVLFAQGDTLRVVSDGTNWQVTELLVADVVITATQSFTIPGGWRQLERVCVGSGGPGGGGGSSSSISNQVGGSGGTAAREILHTDPVTPGTVLTCTVGAIVSGGNGGASGGNAGTTPSSGNATTVSGSGLPTLTSPGGLYGKGGGANSSSQPGNNPWGNDNTANGTVSATASYGATGGTAANSAGYPGGGPVGLASGAGGAGGPTSATLGGGAGLSGAPIPSASVVNAGASGTTAGVNATAPVATSWGAGGGGGGGGAWNGGTGPGAGGNGAAGGPGVIVLRRRG